MLHDPRQALKVRASDAPPMLEALQRVGAQLKAILVTHLHTDHPELPIVLREHQINLFLRSRLTTVLRAVSVFGASASDALSIFAALRRWKT